MDKILLTARYVEGDLSESEYDEFENVIEHDKELQQYLEHYKIISRSLDIQLMGALASSKKKNETAILHIHKNKPAKQVGNLARVLIVVTMIALSIVFGIFFFLSNYTYYEKFKITDSEMITRFKKSSHVELNQAAAHVGNGEYYEAKQIIEKLYLKNPDNNRVANHYAAILLANNCLETSKEVLYPVVNGTDENYKFEAAYMIALSFLMEGNIDACRQWLSEIPRGSKRYLQANQLLSKLIANN